MRPAAHLSCILTVASFVLVPLLSFGCGRPDQRQGERRQTVAVGALVPLTGPGSEMGPATRDGFTLYWETHGDLLGRRVETLVEDNKGNARDGLTAFYALQARAGGKLVLLLTQLSGVAAAVAPNTRSVGFLQFGLAATPALLQHPWNYRTYASADRIGNMLASAPSAVPNLRRIFVLAMADEYARAVADAFNRAAVSHGIEVVGTELFPADATDISSVVQRALVRSPDAVVVTGFGRAPVSCIRRLREVGFAGPIFGDPAAAYRPYAALIGDAAEGLYVVDVDFPSDQPSQSATDFRNAFVAKYQREPDLGNVLAYAGMEVFGEAVRRAGSVAPESLATVLDQGFTVLTALGRAQLVDRDTHYPLVLKVIRSGEARRVR